MIFGKKKNWDDEYDEYYTQQDPEYGRRAKPLLWAHLAALAIIFGLFFTAVGLAAGGKMVEKVAKELCTPVGFIWLVLMLLIYFSLVYRAGRTAITAALCWVVLSVGGNDFVADFLAAGLEKPYQSQNPYEEKPFDYLIVLGGGTNVSPYGSAQLESRGDRVMTAARLYFRERVKKIVATGQQLYKSDPNDLHPNQEVVQILKDLQIPESDLLMLGGINTSEEIQQIRKWLDTLPDKENLRVGLLTSAWHLPRATALAEKNGVSVIPVPSDFASEPYVPDPGIVVPTANNLHQTATMIHEYLGRLIGR